MAVLVVDDSRAMRMIIRRELRSGVEIDDVVEADSGVGALEAVGAGGIDLVLSDWNMPEMSGIELLESLRASGWTGPFGFITSESGQATKVRAFDAGATFVITKPFTGENLNRVVRNALGWDVAPRSEGGSPTTDDSGPTVATVLSGLLRREVTAVEASPPRLEVARTVARYVDADGRAIATCVAEIGFAAATGAALSLAPASAAAEWADAGVLTEAMAQEFLRGGQRSRIGGKSRWFPLQAGRADAAGRLRTPARPRATGRGTEPRQPAGECGESYGSGRIAFITLDGAAVPASAGG